MKTPENTADVDSKTKNVLPLTDYPIPTGISAAGGNKARESLFVINAGRAVVVQAQLP